jgi:CO/xanthine dehydrogenase FAD-binding subunit
LRLNSQLHSVPVPTGSNVRGSAAYRTHLAQVLTRRALQELEG